jgi:hypothetical protein
LFAGKNEVGNHLKFVIKTFTFQHGHVQMDEWKKCFFSGSLHGCPFTINLVSSLYLTWLPASHKSLDSGCNTLYL